jgi:hypothetical protein
MTGEGTGRSNPEREHDFAILASSRPTNTRGVTAKFYTKYGSIIGGKINPPSL